MNSRMHWLAWLMGVCLLASTAGAQEGKPASDADDDEEATHNELRAMREALTKAVLEGDADAQVAHAHENVVITWQNHQVVRGTDGLKNFLQQMNIGETKVFQGYKVPPAVDELTILYGGDTGIAFGSSTPHYKYMGMEFDLQNRWTATLVKSDGTWKIAAYHVSGNILDNPVLTIAKQTAYWAGGIGLVVGLVAGILVTSLWKRRAAGTA